MKPSFRKVREVGEIMLAETGKTRLGFLVALLVILAAAGYTYYFTDILKFGQENRTDSSQSIVRKPLPPRPNGPLVVQEAKPAAQSQQVTPASPAVKPEQQSHQSMETKTSSSQPAKMASSTKPIKQPAGQKIQATSAAPSIKANVSKKDVPHKEEEIAAEKSDTEAHIKPVKGKYTLLLGVYVVDKGLAAEKAKVKALGLTPVVVKGPKKMTTMNRLLVGQYDSYAEASAELHKIRKISTGAFMLPENEKFTVYAGSYFVKERAKNERGRLNQAGVQLVLKEIQLSVPTLQLTAGSFQSRKSAQQEAERLSKHGIKGSVIGSGI